MDNIENGPLPPLPSDDQDLNSDDEHDEELAPDDEHGIHSDSDDNDEEEEEALPSESEGEGEENDEEIADDGEGETVLEPTPPVLSIEIDQEAVQVQPSPIQLLAIGTKRGGDPNQDMGQPSPKRVQNVANHGTIAENLQKICVTLQEIFGQPMADLGALFVRNEPALSTAVEELRRHITLYQGQMGELMDTLATALGPPKPLSVSSSSAVDITETTTTNGDNDNAANVVDHVAASTDETSEQPAMAITAPLVIADRNAKEVLHHLGKVLSLHAAVIRNLGYGTHRAVPVSSTEANDINRVPYIIGLTMNQLGDMMQYTYRRKLHNVANDLNSQIPRLKTRLDDTVTKVTEVLNATPASVESTLNGLRGFPILQVSPAVVFPEVEDPQIRYQIAIGPDELMRNLPEVSEDPFKPFNGKLPQQTLNVAEDNLWVRYGPFTLINGTRTLTITYKMHEIQFQIHQFYTSDGWVDPSKAKPDGFYTRSLEFDLTKFEEDSARYRVKEKSLNVKSEASEGQKEQIEIVVSGIIRGLESTKKEESRRVEFVFILPSNLSINHINDVGKRDGILKIQFAM